eukprot:9068218-Alexandrium_andersonii.AAC.1
MRSWCRDSTSPHAALTPLADSSPTARALIDPSSRNPWATPNRRASRTLSSETAEMGCNAVIRPCAASAATASSSSAR